MAAQRITPFVHKGACESKTQRSRNCESLPQALYFVAEVRPCQNQRS